MARNPRSSRTTRKVNLRAAYEMGGYTGDYSWFVRTKAVPIIGESALHPLPTQRGSRVHEYSVTRRNLHRVVKALGIESTRYKQVQAVKKAVSSAGAEATAELIVKMAETTAPEPGYSVSITIPVHPISNNAQYEYNNGRVVSTARHKDYKERFAASIRSINPDLSSVDFNKSMDIHMHFGHREASARGYKFDRNNFQKAAIDELYRHAGRDDSLVHRTSMSGEFVNEYSEGFIRFDLRNIS